MKFVELKYFGTLSGILSSIILIFVQFIFKLNIVFVHAIGQVSIYIWLGIVLTFLLFATFNKTIKRTTLNWIYLLVAIFSFIYLNSMFQWSVECCPEKYDSMYDWNSSKGLVWIFSVPISFVILLIQGLVYDFLRNMKFKRTEKTNVL
jgi:hypothetical protein